MKALYNNWQIYRAGWCEVFSIYLAVNAIIGIHHLDHSKNRG